MKKFNIFAAVLIFGSIYLLFFQGFSKVHKAQDRPSLRSKSKTQSVQNKRHVEGFQMLDIPLITKKEIPSTDKNIFFIETNRNITSFSGRLLCTFESCAAQNPDRNINIVLQDIAEKAKFPKYLEAFKNVKFSRVNFNNVASGTPVGHLFESGSIRRSRYHLAHISDIMRLVLMYRYGGAYMDTDIVFINKVPEVSFVAPISRNKFANGVLGFTKGHKFVNECLSDVGVSYKPWAWESNGPMLITRKLKQYCKDPNPNAETRTDLKSWICPDFKILPIRAYFPIAYPGWRKYFNPKVEDLGLFNSTIGVHYWNNMRNEDARKRDNHKYISRDHPLFKIMEQYCPLTVKHVMMKNIGKEYK